MSVRFQTIDEFAEGQRLDNYLLKHLKGVPKSHIYRIIRKGEVRVNKGRKKAAYKLCMGEVVRIPPIRLSKLDDVEASDTLKTHLQNAILFEDKGLLAINKPSGLAAHGGSGITLGLIEALRTMHKAPIELVHRLDRATSGVLLIAKKRSVLKHLHEQLRQNHIEKRYVTLVKGVWSKRQHTVDAPLSQHSRGVTVETQGKPSITHFWPTVNFHRPHFEASLVEVLLETGRMHQIRVHAQYAGHEIAGDDKYGDKPFNQQVQSIGLNRLFLHAKQLIFTNPMTGEIQKIHAPLPPALQQFIDLL